MEKQRHTLLLKMVVIASMASILAVAASAQTQFVRNGDFIISEELNVSGNANLSSNLVVGGIITGDGSGITNINANNIDLDPLLNNDSMLFGNITRLDNRIDDVNASIQGFATSAVTNVGSETGNFSAGSNDAAINLSGQVGGTSVSNTGNIFTFALDAINSVITTFTNFVTFNNGIQVNGNANVTGTMNATSFIGDGSQLTGVTAANADNATFAASAGNATFAQLASNATFAATADTANTANNATFAAQASNATHAASVNCEDIYGGTDNSFCDDQQGDSDWESNGQDVYNVSASVGIGTTQPSARLDVIQSQRLGSDSNNNSFIQRNTFEVSGVTGYTTILEVEASTLTSVDTQWRVTTSAQGNTVGRGNGALDSEWTVEITGGAYTLTRRSEDKYDDQPQFRLTSTGNTVNLQIGSNDLTGAFTGFVDTEVRPAQGAGANGATVQYTVRTV